MGYYAQMSSCLDLSPCALKRTNNNNNAEQRWKKKDTDWGKQGLLRNENWHPCLFCVGAKCIDLSEAVMLV